MQKYYLKYSLFIYLFIFVVTIWLFQLEISDDHIKDIDKNEF